MFCTARDDRPASWNLIGCACCHGSRVVCLFKDVSSPLFIAVFSPAVLAGPSSQRAAGQRVEVGDLAQRPGGHGETLAGGGGAEAAHRPVQAALAEARRLERSPGVRHCAGSSQR